MKEDEDIEIMFSKFQILVSGLQVLNKSYIIVYHVKKILKSKGKSVKALQAIEYEEENP
jgi:hypothetical protein